MAILNVPGLRGYQAQRMMQNQQQQNELGQIQGILGIQNSLAQAQMNRQLMPLKMAELQGKVAAQRRNQGIIDRYLGGAMGGAMGGGQGEVTGTQVERDAGGMPMTGGMSVPGMPVTQRGGGILDVVQNPEAVAALKLAGIDLTDMYKTMTTPQEYKGGSIYRSRIDGAERMIPRLGEGQIMGAGGMVSAAPGYVDTVGQVASAQEQARAQFDIVQVPDGRGGTISMPRSVAAQRLGGAPMQGGMATATGAGAAPGAGMATGMAPGMVPQSQFPMVSPQEQATRDAEAAAIRNREVTGGGIPTSSVVPGSTAGMPGQAATQAAPQLGVTKPPVKGEEDYMKGRISLDLETLKQLEKSANSSFNQIKTLDRFIESSKKGFSGGVAPLISGVSNMLSSFGYTSEQLQNTVMMEQAIGDILGNKMAELGARGLTDQDMKILREALPRVATDANARIQVAEVLKKNHEAILSEYANARQEEARIYPDVASKVRNPAWYKEYLQSKGIDPNQSGQNRVRRYNPQTRRIE